MNKKYIKEISTECVGNIDRLMNDNINHMSPLVQSYFMNKYGCDITLSASYTSIGFLNTKVYTDIEKSFNSRGGKLNISIDLITNTEVPVIEDFKYTITHELNIPSDNISISDNKKSITLLFDVNDTFNYDLFVHHITKELSILRNNK